jgi:L-ascorbate metabolism protein UlaG (beta-lactamase superfamily)
MQDMKIQRFYHSCFQITEGDSKILIDPGSFCFLPGRARPEDFVNIQGIFITHEHADHADPAALKTIMQNNACKIYSNNGVVDTLAKEGIEVEEIQDDQIVTLGGLKVQAKFAPHQPLPAVVPQNTAFIVNKKFLHPGDSLSEKLYEFQSIPVLALPVAGPILNLLQSYEFLQNMKPKHAIQIHDGMVIDVFQKRLESLMGDLAQKQGTEYHALRAPQGSLEISLSNIPLS